MLTFHATEQINEVSRTTTQVITRYFGRWPQTKMKRPVFYLVIFSTVIVVVALEKSRKALPKYRPMLITFEKNFRPALISTRYLEIL